MIDPIASFLGEWSTGLNISSILFRCFIGFIFGGIIGWQRSIKRHSIGLRTYIIVVLVAVSVGELDLALKAPVPILSAMAILSIANQSVHTLFTSSRNQIRGFTTSIGLWACGIFGIALGFGYYTLSIVSFLGTMMCMFFMPALQKTLKDRSNHFEVHLELTDSHYLQNFVSTIRELGMKIDDIEFNPAYLQSGLSVYSVGVSINSELLKKFKTHEDIITALNTLDYVNHIEEIL